MYNAEISRINPGAFFILIDQSGSMADWTENGNTLSNEVADIINRFLQELVIKCSKSEGVRNYFEVAVLAYGHKGCYNGLDGPLGQDFVHPISSIADFPLKIEERKKKIPDGAGGVIEQNINFPIWFEPVANGGTPMCEAFHKVAELLVQWCDDHQESFPPIVINITDGEPTDGDPEPIVEQIKEISTADGNVLVFNVHLSTNSEKEIKFIDDSYPLFGPREKKLFRMSSVLTPAMRSQLINENSNVTDTSRGYIYNGSAFSLIELFEIGTRAANLR
ncbi:VWA domain-containing protein [Fictibacillus halophilus]|uniref:VWA domain-containing protein n=1 Tax=Fictibacillus halophilus TaxID=1610490 RepID=UPI003627AB43